MAKTIKKKKKSKSKARKAADQSILDMSAKDARTFFLKAESYCSVDLPPYFDFDKVLQPVSKILDSTPLALKPLKSRKYEGVNYTIYSNKDGRLAWRPFQLVHPALYIDLAKQITEPKAWKSIKARFKEFSKDPNIQCLSIPVQSIGKSSDKAAQILTWWQGIEQASIELSLDYNYIYHADITDCYSSIYTHSIPWALHTKKVSKTNRTMALIGNVIDCRIQDMRHGQTNGIPQGSVLMDFIAEMVLGYADLELSDRLRVKQITEYKILRYRDDYRIFVNSPQYGEEILKTLTEVLMEINLKLHAGKTTDAQAVIPHSIKRDKKRWMRSRQYDDNLQKHLLLIHCHSTDYPNAGSLLVALDEFYRRIVDERNIKNIIQLISITVDIGYHSPRCFPVCAAIISKLLSRFVAKSSKLDALERIRNKLKQLPHNGHLEVWQQRLSYPFDPKIAYQDSLCKLVEGDSVELWSNDWISDAKLEKALNPEKIVRRMKLRFIEPIVPRLEYSLFYPYI